MIASMHAVWLLHHEGLGVTCLTGCHFSSCSVFYLDSLDAVVHQHAYPIEHLPIIILRYILTVWSSRFRVLLCVRIFVSTCFPTLAQLRLINCISLFGCISSYLYDRSANVIGDINHLLDEHFSSHSNFISNDVMKYARIDYRLCFCIFRRS